MRLQIFLGTFEKLLGSSILKRGRPQTTCNSAKINDNLSIRRETKLLILEYELENYRFHLFTGAL